MRKMYRAVIIALFTSVILINAGIAPAAEKEMDNGSEAPGGRKIKPREGWNGRGLLRIKDVLGFSSEDGDFDHDFYATLRYDLYNYHRGRKKYGFHMLGTVRADLDGETSRFEPLYDVYDNFKASYNTHVYSAYFEARDAAAFSLARLGRQTLSRGDGLNFDGLRLDLFKPKYVGFSFFGGLPAYYFSDRTSRTGDLFTGAGIDKKFGRTLRLRAHYVFIRDAGDDGADDKEDDLVIAKFNYRPLKDLAFEVKAKTINTEDAGKKFSLYYRNRPHGLMVKITYKEQSTTVTDYTTALSPFYVFLGELRPYKRGRLQVMKYIDKKNSLDLGLDVRTMFNADDEGPLNHSYSRIYAGAQFENCWTDAFDFSVKVSAWNADDEDSTSSAGFTGTYKQNDWKIFFGSDFELYKYDFQTDTDRENVTTFFIRFKKSYASGLSLYGGYSLEVDSETTVSKVSVSMKYKW